ncbi:MAG: dienelactone hydrolase family protein, partial [Proteobacteria bacterium]|nr:dienelactone hydrolase family protein [Pseudomonadota bacterium]
MKYVFTLFIMLLVAATANAAGTFISYEVNGEPYEGYFVSPSPDAALVLLIHDWDGLT